MPFPLVPTGGTCNRPVVLERGDMYPLIYGKSPISNIYSVKYREHCMTAKSGQCTFAECFKVDERVPFIDLPIVGVNYRL